MKGNQMAKFTAHVDFIVLEFDADNHDDANDKVNKLMDELGVIETSLSWDDVEWTVRDEEETA
jgi:hypothetical protein